MLFSSLLLASLAGLGFAAPVERDGGKGNVLYWGQNGGEQSLGTYCAPEAGVDIVVLSFLYVWGNGQIPNGNFGSACAVLADGTGQGCDALIADIATCKANGKKVIISLGGAAGSYSLASADDAKDLATKLWNSYGAPGTGDAGAPRPLGDTIVDGFDLDIEASSTSAYLGDLATALRDNFAKDTAHTYYVTGAPQCPIPEPNMGAALTSAQFDMLFIQFYNNYCSAYQAVRGDASSFNFGDWPAYLAQGPSANAQIYLGLPASPLGSTGTESGAQYFLSTSELTTVVQGAQSTANFGGVMLWSAQFSDSQVDNGCTYAQNVRKLLDTGATC